MDTKTILKEFFRYRVSAVVTMSHWTTAPDGERYLSLFCKGWTLTTDKMIDVPGFRSSERWQLVAISGGAVKAVFPGCAVKSVLVCHEKPGSNDCFELK